MFRIPFPTHWYISSCGIKTYREAGEMYVVGPDVPDLFRPYAGFTIFIVSLRMGGR